MSLGKNKHKSKRYWRKLGWKFCTSWVNNYYSWQRYLFDALTAVVLFAGIFSLIVSLQNIYKPKSSSVNNQLVLYRARQIDKFHESLQGHPWWCQHATKIIGSSQFVVALHSSITESKLVLQELLRSSYHKQSFLAGVAVQQYSISMTGSWLSFISWLTNMDALPGVVTWQQIAVRSFSGSKLQFKVVLNVYLRVR